jgi:hypothetical protein
VADTKPPTQPFSPGDAYSERRRTQRVQISMPVIVRGKIGTQTFEEEARTVSINANGCMALVAMNLTRSQEVSLINPKTVEELPCKIVFLGKKVDGKTEVGFEFVEASPLFWRIAFPPEDWDPAERKKPSNQPLRPIAGPPWKR